MLARLYTHPNCCCLLSVAVGLWVCLCLFWCRVARAQIACNYLQVLALMGGFEVPWGSAVSTFFSLSSSTSSAPVGASFVQCTMQLNPFDRFHIACGVMVVGAILLLAFPLYDAVLLLPRCCVP